MLTIKNKFIIAGVLSFISILGMLAVGQYTVYEVSKYNAVSIKLGHVESGMLMLRHNEKDFLSRNDLKYKKKFEENYLKLEVKVSDLSNGVSKAGIDTSLVSTLNETFKLYKSGFLDLVSVQQEIGLHSKDGLYGSLREAVHNAESKINTLGDQMLRADMLQLRRNEKDFMLRRDIKYLDKFTKNFTLFTQHLDKSEYALDTKDEIKALMKQYHTGFNDLVAKNQHKGLTPKKGLLGKLRLEVNKSEKLLAQIAKKLKSTIEEEVGSLDTLIIMVDIVGFVIAVTIVAVIGWLAYGILLPIQDLAKTMGKAAAENDLTLRLKIKTDDEIGETSLAFNTMLEKFQTMVGEVNGSATQIAAASEEMSCIAHQTSQGIQEQQLQTDRTAAAINQMADTVQDVAKNAEAAARAADLASSESNTGSQEVKTTAETINTLSESIERAAASIQRVEEGSESIGTVMNVIRGIAEQTNLLALNAAIEAARAGEQGRGFAVVADEVRTLASRTQESTQEIQAIIESLQSGTKEAVQLMAESRELTQHSVEQTSKAGDALTGIVNAVTSINEMNKLISSASEGQATVAEEINRNIVSITEVTNQSAQGSDQTAKSSEELASLSAELQGLVLKFKT